MAWIQEESSSEDRGKKSNIINGFSSWKQASKSPKLSKKLLVDETSGSCGLCSRINGAKNGFPQFLQFFPNPNLQFEGFNLQPRRSTASSCSQRINLLHCLVYHKLCSSMLYFLRIFHFHLRICKNPRRP